jgi:hypothetical protein
MDGNTFKVYLTADQWARVCQHDDEVKAEVAKQQPELFAAIEKEHPTKTTRGHRTTVIDK